MQKVLILKGLPASGKSTFAKKYCEKNIDWVRVNRDDLRKMRGKYWIPKQERMITAIERACIYTALNYGKHVIIDATNLNHKRENKIRQWIKDWEREYESRTGESIRTDVEIKVFDTDYKECIKRDLKRTESVGQAVIKGMYDKYLKPKQIKMKQNKALPSAIVCDLDGTVAIHVARSPYDFMRCYTDLLNEPIAKIVKKFLYNNGSPRIIYMSGREDKSYNLTKEWLKKHALWNDNCCGLHMRKAGDNRKDCIIKRELFEKYIKDKYYVDFVLDDRNQVVEMWREMGLICLQVAEGNF